MIGASLSILCGRLLTNVLQGDTEVSVECVKIVPDVEKDFGDDGRFEDALECLFALSDHRGRSLAEDVDIK